MDFIAYPKEKGRGTYQKKKGEEVTPLHFLGLWSYQAWTGEGQQANGEQNKKLY